MPLLVNHCAAAQKTNLYLSLREQFITNYRLLPTAGPLEESAAHAKSVAPEPFVVALRQNHPLTLCRVDDPHQRARDDTMAGGELASLAALLTWHRVLRTLSES